MYSHFIIYGCLALAPMHFIFSAILSKEVFAYEQSLAKLVSSILIIWLVPILGSFIIYKLLNLNWFEAPVENVTGGQTVVGGGMAELNAILNPKHRHVVEAKERETIELNLDGQLHHSKLEKELIEEVKNHGSETKT